MSELLGGWYINIVVSFFWPSVWWSMVVFGPLMLLGLRDVVQKKHAISRNFPVIGHGRFILEAIRPEIMQYFVETNTEGRPLNRINRSMIYQRAKKVNDTAPFGTQMDVYAEGYEWMDHSMFAKNQHLNIEKCRITIGSAECTQPYSSSLLNISAMSFGSLSKNAILALNGGAEAGNFAHNTGEGSISPYHLQPGGDLIWQIGTGYFGCRTKEGGFNANKFKENSALPQVKMIEIKLSQGAKPGHGGILPASKNSPEIAAIRGVKPHTDVMSPPAHTAFDDVAGLLQFVKQLRELSGGKPIGFKLCIGKKREFVAICEEIKKTGIQPDFITIDGGEGGTGAAPIEFSNSLGMPMLDALAFAYNTLLQFDLKKDIRLVASGKVLSGFDMARALALGADLCNSARAMMLALGCIQALKCNTNTCPVGIATQDKGLMHGLDVSTKTQRVFNYHEETIKSLTELVAAAGLESPAQLQRYHINRRTSMNEVMRYDQIFPYREKVYAIDQRPI